MLFYLYYKEQKYTHFVNVPNILVTFVAHFFKNNSIPT